jgi:hypothetical protein
VLSEIDDGNESEEVEISRMCCAQEEQLRKRETKNMKTFRTEELLLLPSHFFHSNFTVAMTHNT